jgi:2-keto-3-deoxy-galactonokinase
MNRSLPGNWARWQWQMQEKVVEFRVFVMDQLHDNLTRCSVLPFDVSEASV